MGRKGSNAKNLEVARTLKSTKERYLRFSLLALCGAMICLIGYSFIANTGILVTSGMAGGLVTNMVFIIIAGVVGVFTHKWSKASRAYKEFIAQSGISENEL